MVWGDLITLEYGKPVSDKGLADGKVPVYGTNGQIGTSNLPAQCSIPSIIIGRKGAYRGVKFSEVPFSVIDTAFYALPKVNNLNMKWAYYKFLTYNINKMDSGSAIPSTDRYEIYSIPVELPPIEEQNKIVSFLECFDNKITINEKINKNLEQQVECIYDELFKNKKNPNRRTCKMSEYFDVTIGKTPPRKESEWFSQKDTDITWVSISDMGKSGVYICNSSEKLTQEAIDKFNIKIVPSGTVILSFKLTVGRVAITCGDMATNEAIAHFNTDSKLIKEYLYIYLKKYNYRTLGNTSSIATAVNSKIIKSMPFIIPEDKELLYFHNLVQPLFNKILNNQIENSKLIKVRDSLLPKFV